jgi:hypothetical protein
VKKDVDKGLTHKDMFYLQLDKNDSSGLKWKWVSTKPGGTKPSPRCGFSVVVTAPNKALMFGGVYDEEEHEDQLKGAFYGDMYQLEVDKGRWYPLMVSGRKEVRRRRRKVEGGDEGTSRAGHEDSSGDDTSDVTDSIMDTMNLGEEKITNDEVFTVKVGSTATNENEAMQAETSGGQVTRPRPRMNAGLAVKHGVLYVYGGSYEEGDRQITLGDMYTIDLHKLTEWQVLVPPDITLQEWIESSDSSSDEEEEGGGESSEGSEEETSDEDEMETD